MATSQNWPGYIPNGDIDPDSPLTTGLFTDLRNSISNLADRVGTPTTYDPDVEDHNHDGDNSKQVANQGLFGTGSLGDIAFVASGAFPAGGVLDYGSLTIAAGATITVPDGFVVIRCTGDCTINGRIDATGGGGAGGTGGGNAGNPGVQPFDFLGYQTAAGGGSNTGAANNAGGGGGGAGVGGDGGRGGDGNGATRGTAGTNSYADDAATYGIDDAYWLLQGAAFANMRGGGGGEGGNGNDGGSGKDGGAGGGTVILLVQGDLSGSGKILCNGDDGVATPTDQTRGGGGGGGGGLIYILCEGAISGSLDLQAAGGDGSNATSSADAAGGGGGGGGGAIVTKATGTIAGTSTDVTGGTKGTSDGGNAADDGDAGYTDSQASVDVRGSWT